MNRSFMFRWVAAAMFVATAVVFIQAQAAKRAEAPRSKTIDAKRLLADIEYLASDELEGRSADLPSMQKSRDFVEKRFRESGLQPLGDGYQQTFDFSPRRSETKLKGVNFIGQIKGSKHPDKYIVITAHYDHDGVRNGQIYNGADDNASGTAALFAMAKHFSKKKPKHTLIFVAFDAEEKGLVGARHFVANLPVKKESILLNVNMDMISRSDKNELYAVGTSHYPQFKPALQKVQKKAKIKLLLGHDVPGTGREDWTFQSDQGAFHREKIPFLYFGVEDHDDYHKPTDDFERIHREFYVRAVETIIAAVKGLDR